MIITDKAKAFIEDHMKENGIMTLRFSFAGAGCCGPNYGVSIAEEEATDVIEMVNGLKVAMDQHIAEVVKSITIDFEDAPDGPGLVVSGGGNCC